MELHLSPVLEIHRMRCWIQPQHCSTPQHPKNPGLSKQNVLPPDGTRWAAQIFSICHLKNKPGFSTLMPHLSMWTSNLSSLPILSENEELKEPRGKGGGNKEYMNSFLRNLKGSRWRKESYCLFSPVVKKSQVWEEEKPTGGRNKECRK